MLTDNKLNITVWSSNAWCGRGMAYKYVTGLWTRFFRLYFYVLPNIGKADDNVVIRTGVARKQCRAVKRELEWKKEENIVKVPSRKFGLKVDETKWLKKKHSSESHRYTCAILINTMYSHALVTLLCSLMASLAMVVLSSACLPSPWMPFCVNALTIYSGFFEKSTYFHSRCW